MDGIRKEAARVREEWENCGGNPSFEDGRSVLHVQCVQLSCEHYRFFVALRYPSGGDGVL